MMVGRFARNAGRLDSMVTIWMGIYSRNPERKTPTDGRIIALMANRRLKSLVLSLLELLKDFPEFTRRLITIFRFLGRAPTADHIPFPRQIGTNGRHARQRLLGNLV